MILYIIAIIFTIATIVGVYSLVNKSFKEFVPCIGVSIVAVMFWWLIIKG